MALPLDPRQSLYLAVAAELTARGTADHPLAEAARAASQSAAPELQAAFKAALDASPEAWRDGLMAAVHRRMREDMLRLIDFLPGMGQKRTLH